MTGTLKKVDNRNWVVLFNETEFPIMELNPDSLLPFENFEVEFELEDFWETGLEEVFKIAVIKTFKTKTS